MFKAIFYIVYCLFFSFGFLYFLSTPGPDININMDQTSEEYMESVVKYQEKHYKHYCIFQIIFLATGILISSLIFIYDILPYFL